VSCERAGSGVDTYVTSAPKAPSGCQAVRSIIRDTAETRPSPPERAERLQARVSNSSVWYSTPPGRNESLQCGHVRLLPTRVDDC